MSEEKKSEKADQENVFVSPECPVKKVTVYSDRAEVCRQIDTSVVKGVNEVVLKQLPASIDSDSIRVEGTGQATIAEVTFQRKYETQDEADISSKEKELEAQLKDLTKEKEQLVAKQNVLTKQWKLLDNFGDTVSTAAKTNATTLDTTYFKGVTDFLQLYNDEGGKLETSRLELQEQLAKLEEKLNTTSHNLIQLRGNRSCQKESRECTIILESEGDSKVTLIVSYVVTQAYWLPSYDIRMFTAEGSLKIMYYGQITQSTGEDWIDAKLFLSTASPSIGGTVPDLSVAVLSIKQHHVRPKAVKRSSFRNNRAMMKMATRGYDLTVEDCAPEIMEMAAAPRLEMAYVETKVNESTTSTSYEIARQSTVPSDNLPHKVSVGIFDVKPTLEYVTIPKIAPRAFLRAKVTNSSTFTLLPGATSIFLDNSFVAKAEIKSVSPGEEFECSLGVDPAVRVTYKPVKKFRESSGFIRTWTHTTNEQPIEIKNTHDYPIKIEVKEQLPRSSDEKIKVTLLDPVLDMKHPEKNKNPHLNMQHHVIWDLEVEKQATREITLKYTIEHPAGNEVQTTEHFENDGGSAVY